MKVVVTARNFSTDDKTALQILQDAGFEVEDHSKEDIGSGTNEEYIRSLVLDAYAVICGPEKVSNKAIAESKNLKIVSRRGIGYDSIDIDFCKKNGIAVARALGTVEGSVAESVMAYILYFARRIDLQSESMNKGEWKRIMTPGAKSHTLGLIGFGGIGKEIAKRAVPFGMEVLYYCRHPKDEFGAHYAELDELLAKSDYVSINVPLNESTVNMIDKKIFSKITGKRRFRGQVFACGGHSGEKARLRHSHGSYHGICPDGLRKSVAALGQGAGGADDVARIRRAGRFPDGYAGGGIQPHRGEGEGRPRQGDGTEQRREDRRLSVRDTGGFRAGDAGPLHLPHRGRHRPGRG